MVEDIRTVLQEADDECAEYAEMDISNMDKIGSVGELFENKFHHYMAKCQSDSEESSHLKHAIFHWFMRFVMK